MPPLLSLWRLWPQACLVAGRWLRAPARVRGTEPEVGGSGRWPERPATRGVKSSGILLGRVTFANTRLLAAAPNQAGPEPARIPLPPSFSRINDLFRPVGIGSVWWRFGRRQPGPCEPSPEGPTATLPRLSGIQFNESRNSVLFFVTVVFWDMLNFGINPQVSISGSNTPSQ